MKPGNLKLRWVLPLGLFWIGTLALGAETPNLLTQAQEALAQRDLSRAQILYSQALAQDPEKTPGDRYYRIFKLLWDSRNVKPEITQKILVLGYRQVQMPEKPQPITPEDWASYQLNLGLFARTVEAFSRGKVAVKLDPVYLNGTLTRLNLQEDKTYITPDYASVKPFPFETLSRRLAEADIVFQIYRMPYHTYCFGGTDRPDLVPYTLWAPRRGQAQFNTFRNLSMTLIFHEYFHTMERPFSFYSQDKFLKGNLKDILTGFPDYPLGQGTWKDDGLDYWEWQFSQNIPRILEEAQKTGDSRGWKRLSFVEAEAPVLTQDQLENAWMEVRHIPLEDLQKIEGLKKSADEAWKAGDKALADELYRKIQKTNPGYPDSYRHFAERAAQEKNIPQALELYKKYFQLTQDWYQKMRAGEAAFREGGQKALGRQWFTEAWNLARGASKTRVVKDWAWSLYDQKPRDPDLERVLALVEPGAPLDEVLGEVEFLRALVYLDQEKREGVRQAFQKALDRGADSNKYLARRASGVLYNLVQEKKWDQAAFWGPLAQKFQEPRWKHESGFLTGEALWNLGQKPAGEAFMVQALEALDSAWWENRFKKITGKPFPGKGKP